MEGEIREAAGDRYEAVLARISVILVTRDPEGLIELGAPQDEYSREAQELTRLALKEELTPDALKSLWTRQFGADARLLSSTGRQSELLLDLVSAVQ